MTVAVEVAKAALCEAGYPDLAALVEANRARVPAIRNTDAHAQHRNLIVRAFWLGHLAAGHRVKIGRCVTSDFEWTDCLECDTCEALPEFRSNR